MQSLYETYHNMYYDGNNFYNDIVEFCEELNIFESSEETEYFADLIIENDLGLTFVEDIVEYFKQGQLLDESYIIEGVPASALRGIVNALSAAGRSKAGLSAATAL